MLSGRREALDWGRQLDITAESIWSKGNATISRAHVILVLQDSSFSFSELAPLFPKARKQTVLEFVISVVYKIWGLEFWEP